MSSPFQFSLSNTPSTSTQYRPRSSTDKPGLVQRTSSTSSLHRITSNKSNSSTGATSKGHKHHHAHVAHTSASKHHRATSFGHRVPSYGKGLNKLTALTTVNTGHAPKEYLSIHSIVDRPGRPTMQRSCSEGSTLAKKQRRQLSSSSIHSSRQRVRRSNISPHERLSTTNKNATKQIVQFSTHYSSDEEDDDEIIVHRKSSAIVESPQSHSDVPYQLHPVSPSYFSTIQLPPTKSALKEGLSSSAPKFLPKSLSAVSLVPPKVSITNAHSKDLARPSTSVERQVYRDGSQSTTPCSDLQIPTSNPASHFISSTPPSRASRTPDLDGLRRNQSSTSFATDPIPLPSASQGKLTRTQQKLLLQRASTQYPIHPLTSTMSGYTSSPSLQQTARMEVAAPDYFSPLPCTTQTTLAPGVATNIPFDVKAAREFDRISRELVNAKRFGDPTADAIARLQDRVALTSIGSTTTKQGLTKKQPPFGLSMSWKQSPDKQVSRTKGNIIEDDVFGGERSSKIRDVMRRLWFDGAEIADVMELGRADDADEITVRMPRFR